MLESLPFNSHALNLAKFHHLSVYPAHLVIPFQDLLDATSPRHIPVPNKQTSSSSWSGRYSCDILLANRVTGILVFPPLFHPMTCKFEVVPSSFALALLKSLIPFLIHSHSIWCFSRYSFSSYQKLVFLFLSTSRPYPNSFGP